MLLKEFVVFSQGGKFFLAPRAVSFQQEDLFLEEVAVLVGGFQSLNVESKWQQLGT